jgi:hypothetical protein
MHLVAFVICLLSVFSVGLIVGRMHQPRRRA